MRKWALFLLSLPAIPQDLSWKLSLGALGASQALDTYSSYGKIETNPVVGRGQFGPGQAATKSGIAAGLVISEVILVRKWPKLKKTLAWGNVAVSAGTGVVVWHNLRVGR